jgi:hypothetical protein
MPATAANVLVGTTGKVLIAPLGSTAPTGSTPAWAVAWKELGYLSEDGITEDASMDIEEIKAWQSGTIVRRVLTGSGLQWNFTVIETNLDTIIQFYPGSTITAVVGPPAETKQDIKLPVITAVAFGFDILDGTTIERWIVPRAELAGRGERNIVNGDARGFPFTMSAIPDSAGILATKYHNPQLT